MIYQIIPEHTYFCFFLFRHKSLDFICIDMHVIFSFEMFRDSTLLISKSLKRGDVEAKARSSVSPSPQMKTKLKLTASR